MMIRQLTTVCVLTVLCVACVTSSARAQSAQEVVEGLNRDAMDAYNNLDINRAGSMLEEALRIAQTSGIGGRLVSITNLNLGIVYIGGLGDSDGGLGYFVAAMCAEPSVQLDPLTSTPEIQLVFTQAQQQAQGGACGGAPMGGGPPPIGGGGQIIQPPMQPAQVLAHVPPTEQLTQTPLPIYAEVNGRAKIYLFYKGLGMDQFRRVTMTKYFGGVAYQVSCNDVWEPGVSYYIEAHGPTGVIGGAGTAAAPIEVPVVSSRTMPEPALPGATTPSSCAAEECPPGMECAKPGTASIGESCDATSECQSGLSCKDDACTLEDPGPPVGGGGSDDGGWGDEGGDDDYGDDFADGGAEGFKRFFIQLGFTAGLPYVQAGMTADRPAPPKEVFLDKPFREEGPDAFIDPGTPGFSKFGNLQFPNSKSNVVSPWVPDGDSFDNFEEGPNPQGETVEVGYRNGTPIAISGTCSQDGKQTGPRDYEDHLMSTGQSDLNLLFPSKYCVRVKAPGFAFHPAMRANIGYFLTDDFSVAGIWRFQFSAGKGSLANVLMGIRGEYMLLPAVETGVMLSVYTGMTVGQIQAQPPTDSSDQDGSPWIISGMQGGHVGTNFRYRFVPNFGMFIGSEFDVQFPTFLMNVDVTIGPELSF